MLLDGSLVSTDNAWESYQQLYKFEGYAKDSFKPSISYENSTLIICGHFSKDYGTIDIYQSKDEGETWSTGHISDSDIELVGDGNIYSSFINNQNGYLLCCSSSACGMMAKFLFKTNDGGQTYKKVTNLSNIISGYPTGMTFNADGDGFIASSYHGADNAYLYCTGDKGKTWNSLTVQLPANSSYNYINGYPPYFDGNDGFMVLGCVYTGSSPSYIMFYSSDTGKTWCSEESSNLQLSSGEGINNYSFSNNSNVYIIDDFGNMIKKVRDYEEWN